MSLHDAGQATRIHTNTWSSEYWKTYINNLLDLRFHLHLILLWPFENMVENSFTLLPSRGRVYVISHWIRYLRFHWQTDHVGRNSMCLLRTNHKNLCHFRLVCCTPHSEPFLPLQGKKSKYPEATMERLHVRNHISRPAFEPSPAEAPYMGSRSSHVSHPSWGPKHQGEEAVPCLNSWPIESVIIRKSWFFYLSISQGGMYDLLCKKRWLE